MSAARKPAPPKGLSKSSSKFWRDVVSEYDLRPDEMRILGDACREMDLIDRLEEALAESPLMVRGSMGQEVASPLVTEVRQHRMTLKSLLGSLKLPSEDSAAAGTGASAAGAALAAQRWSRSSAA